MFQRIMLPLDGSKLAECALPCAERLVTALGGMLHLVRVVEPPVKQGFAAPHLYDELVTREREAAAAYLQEIGERLAASGMPVKKEMPIGDAASALLDYERAAGINLVVMCSHGRGGLARFASGSVADRLLRHGVAPVLLVRAFGAASTLERAVVPLDGSARSEEALLALDYLAGYVLREVTLLQVVPSPGQVADAERYLEEKCRSIPQPDVLCRGRVEVGDAAQTIGEVAGEDALVVMATHGHTGLARWALGSVADRVVRHGRSPVLLVRAGTVHEDP